MRYFLNNLLTLLCLTFSCLCYPNVKAYTSYTLTSRSERCFFIGYRSIYLDYRCLSLNLYKIFLSHDVVFNESILPFKEISDDSIPTISSSSLKILGVFLTIIITSSILSSSNIIYVPLHSTSLNSTFIPQNFPTFTNSQNTNFSHDIFYSSTNCSSSVLILNPTIPLSRTLTIVSTCQNEINY